MPLPVHTALVQPIAMGNGAKYSASIVPYAQVTLAFQSSGYVDSIRQVKSPSGGMRNIDQGDWVQKGTVLAVVRQQDYLDKVQQAKAQLARSQADNDKAKLTFDRVSALYASQSATKPDYDSAQAQLASTTASVSGAQAQLSEANVALAYCSLRAPFNGWIVSRNVDLGTLVGPATNGFTLADTQSVKAVFGVPDIFDEPGPAGPASCHRHGCFPAAVCRQGERDFTGGGSEEPRVLGGGDHPQSARSVEVGNDSVAGARRVRSCRNRCWRFPCRQSFVTRGVANGFAVMIAEGGGDTETARLRAIELGDIYGNMIAAKGGLNSGESVITTGVALIRTATKSASFHQSHDT